jgi:RNase P/RNase MRP subunit p30
MYIHSIHRDVLYTHEAINDKMAKDKAAADARLLAKQKAENQQKHTPGVTVEGNNHARKKAHIDKTKPKGQAADHAQ